MTVDIAAPSLNGATPEGVPALEIDRLEFAYPDGTPSLRSLSMHVQPGEKIALIGPKDDPAARPDRITAIAGDDGLAAIRAMGLTAISEEGGK